MSEPDGQIVNVTKLCKAFGSENRIEMFLKLLKKKKPVNIATDLEISRAGLQKHIEALLETGLLVKKGKHRNRCAVKGRWLCLHSLRKYETPSG